MGCSFLLVSRVRDETPARRSGERHPVRRPIVAPPPLIEETSDQIHPVRRLARAGSFWQAESRPARLG